MTTETREPWEQELFYNHRWGRTPDRARAEHARLRELWEAARPLTEAQQGILNQIIALEICNWALEESVVALCEAIGTGEPASRGIGHMRSMTAGRWRQVWAYYLAARDWLPCENPVCSGYLALSGDYDADGAVRGHIRQMLGERTRLKELYVERFCLCLEFWLGGFYKEEAAQMVAHRAAVAAVEGEIRQLDPEGAILDAFEGEGDGKLQLCHHKLLRRYDIILSSIGVGSWRGAMPMRGRDGEERAATLESYLVPIEGWIEGQAPDGEEYSQHMHALLGRAEPAKVFLAATLVSLLRAQGANAIRRASAR